MVLYLEHIDTIYFTVEKEDYDFSIGFSILTLYEFNVIYPIE